MSRYKHYSESLNIVARMQFVDVVVAACYRPQKLGGICVAFVALKLQQSNGQSFWKHSRLAESVALTGLPPDRGCESEDNQENDDVVGK